MECYRHGGRQRVTLEASTPDVSLKLARQRAVMPAPVQAGGDVARERQQEKTESAAAKS